MIYKGKTRFTLFKLEYENGIYQFIEFLVQVVCNVKRYTLNQHFVTYRLIFLKIFLFYNSETFRH